jgi:hypothetical protein
MRFDIPAANEPAYGAPQAGVPSFGINETRFLSIRDVQTRWSCGRTFAYEALAEMEAAGYLRRFWLGRCQRVAVESVERYEAEHADQPHDCTRSTVAGMRAANSPPARCHVTQQPSAAQLRRLFRAAV